MHKHSKAYLLLVADWAGGAEQVVACARNLVLGRVEAGQASNLDTCLASQASQGKGIMQMHHPSDQSSRKQLAQERSATSMDDKVGAQLMCRSHGKLDRAAPSDSGL